MLRYRFSVGFALCIFLLCSCSLENGEKEPLQQIEEIIDIHPDSALHLLKEIKNPEKLSKKNRAKYALLFTKAQDKNYIKHTSDSLINIAVDYYSKEKNNKYKAEAYFYLGCIYRDLEYNSNAIDAFLKSLEVIPKEHCDRLVMLIYDNLAQQYEKQEFYDKSMEMAKKSHSYCINHDSKKDIFHSARKIGKIFLYTHKRDSALTYYNLALKIAQSEINSTWESIILCDIARVYNESQDKERAFQYVSESIKKRPNNYPLYPALFLKGRLFAQSNQIDSARFFLLESLKTNNIQHKAATLHELYSIEKLSKDYVAALEYNDQYISLRDSITKHKQREEISALTNEHMTNLERKNDFIKQQRQEFLILLLLLIIICLTTVLVLTIKKKKKEQIISLQKELSRNRVSTLNLDKEIDLENTTINRKDLFIEKLEICISLFKMNPSHDIIYKVHKNKEKHISFEDRENLKESIYETFIDVIEDLKKSFNRLTDADIYCCILYLLHCDNAEVAICMGVLPDTLKVRRSRIKNKISEEYYNFIFKD